MCPQPPDIGTTVVIHMGKAFAYVNAIGDIYRAERAHQLQARGPVDVAISCVVKKPHVGC